MIRQRLLIVEDEHTARRALKLILEDEGYTALEAASGEDGLRLALSEQPDLVLLDIRLPDVDGICSSKIARRWFRRRSDHHDGRNIECQRHPCHPIRRVRLPVETDQRRTLVALDSPRLGIPAVGKRRSLFAHARQSARRPAW